MRQIPGFPNYCITKDGRVWSVKTSNWLKGDIHASGHVCVALYNEGVKTVCCLHRLVLETYAGPCPKDMECRHLNGDPTDNRLKNLKWGTRSENAKDAVRHGTAAGLGRYGDKNGFAKLSNWQRFYILFEYLTGSISQRELSRRFNVTYSTVWCLVNGKVWPFINIVSLIKGQNGTVARNIN